MPLELSVPPERNAPPKDLEIRPKQAKAWIEALPLAQSVEAGRKIRANLAALARSRIDTDDRIQLLEAYRAVSDVVLEELDDVYSKSPLPLTPKAREALSIAREIAQETAHGYKIALLDKTGKLIGFGTKKQIPPLAYRAMQFLAIGIQASYKSYTPLPTGVWKEMHQLFIFADKEGFAADAMDAESKASIADLYLESLLLSLTDPYRLVQGEVDKTIALARGHKGLATLGLARPETNTRAHFLVACDTDRPPKPMAGVTEEPCPNWRLLDTNPLVDRLRQRKAAVETGNMSATMTKMMSVDAMALLNKLIVLWGDPPKRNFRRDAMDTSVAICAGLRTISHFVSQEQRKNSPAEKAAIESGITLPLLDVPEEDPGKGVQVSEWVVVNQSAGGLKVRRDGATAQNIVVGEAIGIKFMGRSRWTVGVVRWITVLDDGGMEFGIQFLAPAARTVAVTPTITSAGTVKLGLLLVESEQSEAADSLLTPPSTYSDLREYEVEEEGNVSCVRATSLIEKTGRFELFHIAPSRDSAISL